MTKFLAFAYADHYPAGGCSDFIGEFDSLDKALASISGDGGEVLEIPALLVHHHWSGKPSPVSLAEYTAFLY